MQKTIFVISEQATLEECPYTITAREVLVERQITGCQNESHFYTDPDGNIPNLQMPRGYSKKMAISLDRDTAIMVALSQRHQKLAKLEDEMAEIEEEMDALRSLRDS